jgi:hypothetical protein
MPDAANRRTVRAPSQLRTSLEINFSEQQAIGEFWNNRRTQLPMARRGRPNRKHVVGASPLIRARSTPGIGPALADALLGAATPGTFQRAAYI